MKRIFRRIFWTILTIVSLFLILVVIWKIALAYWTFNDGLIFMGESLKVLIPSMLLLWILFKLFLERIILHFARKQSGEIIADKIPKDAQVDAPKRTGKDSSQTAGAIVLKETLLRRYKKELNILRQKLYLYDFKKLDKFLNENGSKFFVSSKLKFKKVLIEILRENKSFIKDYWLEHDVDYKAHINSYKFRSGKRVPDIPFHDGITVGGKHPLSMLKRYILVYLRIYLIPNFIMSNQPIIEDRKVTKSGRIKTLYSKIFSVDYVSIKQETPMPFFPGTIVLETETGILYTNTDKEIEKYISNISGIKEFHTIFGHLLEEEAYFRAITQDKNRPNKSLRELYEGFIHIFKMEFIGTRDFIRFNYKVRRLLVLLSRFRYKIIYHYFSFKWINKKIHKLERKLSILHQKDLKLWAKGYIIFYQGIYANIEDSGKNVKYPLLFGIKENKKRNQIYPTHGFKQVAKITDAFGRYNTHMMYTVREAKERIYSEHFTDVENWTSLDMNLEEMEVMKYPVTKKMNQAAVEHRDNAALEKVKQIKKFVSKQREVTVPTLKKLKLNELIDLCTDYGINVEQIDDASETYETDLIKALSIEYRKHHEKPKKERSSQ
jgi:hypothetical protein